MEKGRLSEKQSPEKGYIQAICYSSALKTVDITGFFKKFCIATRTNSSDSSEFEEFFFSLIS